MKFHGVLFFPVTPFAADGSLNEERLAQHVESGVAAGAGGVFVACGTGEFHALSTEEIERATRVAVTTTAGRVPVLAAAGGPTPVARDQAARVGRAGAVIAWEHLRPAVEQDAIQVLLTDHHYWGGLRRTRELAAVCEAFGLALSMHSNSHLGISLAAMTHVAAVIPNLDHSCDTHYPWNFADDVIVPGALELRDGEVMVVTGPGLGVELDHDRLERLHRRYVDSGMRSRDDTGYMRRFRPEYQLRLPRW